MIPKQQFQKDKARALAWGDIVVKPEFNEAVNAALLEMVERQPVHCEVTNAWDAHSQLAGGRVFLDILRNLSSPDVNPVSLPMPNLKSPR